MKKRLLILSVALILLVISTTAFAPQNSSTKKIADLEKQVRDLKAQIVQLKEQGTAVSFTGKLYDGTTELPMNYGDLALPSMLTFKGTKYIQVSFLKDTMNLALQIKGNEAVYFNKTPEGTCMSDIMYSFSSDLMYNSCNNKKDLWLSGNKYEKNFFMEGHKGEGCTFNLKGKYNRFSALIGNQDNTTGIITYEIWGDDNLLYTGVAKPGELAKKIDIDVKGVYKFKFLLKNVEEASFGYGELVVANPMLDKAE